jgi:hypothetical protein
LPEKSSSYTAENIRVLSDVEVEDRCLFARVEALGRRYPHIPEECLERLLAAAQLSGVPEETAVRRYCDDDRTLDCGPEFRETYAQLVRERRR